MLYHTTTSGAVPRLMGALQGPNSGADEVVFFYVFDVFHVLDVVIEVARRYWCRELDKAMALSLGLCA